MLKQIEKHKAIAIPVSFTDGKLRFLTVRDRRFKEWIFVTGGCRKREVFSPIKCALRELEEETRGVVILKKGHYSTFTFHSKNRSPEELEKDKKNGVDITSVYHVFIFVFDIPVTVQQTIITKFYDEKSKTDLRKIHRLPIKRTFDENDLISFDTLEEFNSKNRWSLIVDNIVNNPKFQCALHSSNRQSFNILK
ncbi:NUDIX hydrolase [Flavobacteriaceae bacterium]|nr:NUDIX hydrolase [Flavobacteriaceae bacterium]